MGETAYFENLLRQYESSGDVVGVQKTTPYAVAAGSRPAAVGTGPAPATTVAPAAGPAARQPVAGDDKKPPAKSTALTDATAIYNQMIAAGQADVDAAKAKGVQVSIGTPPPQEFSTSTLPFHGEQQGAGAPMFDPYAEPEAAPGPIGPAPELSGYDADIIFDLPDYKPPVEKAGAGKKAAEEIYQRGRGDMGEQVHNAIISAKSMQNPQARAKYVGEVLRGLGSGLASLSLQAGKAGRAEAGRKRSEQIRTYEAKYKAESAEALAQYDAEMTQAIAQWQADMATWSAGGDIGRRRIKRATSADTKSGRSQTRGM